MTRFVNSGASVTEADIAAAEERLGSSLPADLLRHFTQENGGELQDGRSVYVNEHGFEFRVQTFLPLTHARFPGDVTVEYAYEIFVIEDKAVPAGFIPFALDNGGNAYWMRTGLGTIHVFYADAPYLGMRGVAPSFDAFVDGLVREVAPLRDATS